MQKIIPPINPNSTSNEVTNLQECLLFLLDKKIFKTYQPPNRPTEEELDQWRKMLIEEKALSIFGEGTRQLEFTFQVQQGLGDNFRGVVEETTAAKMNELLKSLGAFLEYLVYGSVVNEDSTPAAGLTVVAFDRDLASEDLLGEAITDSEGAYRISYSEEQFRRSTSEKGGPDIFVRILAKDGKNLFQSNTVRNAPPEQRLDVRLSAGTFIVRGTVYEANDKPARNTIVRAYDQDLRKEQLLGKAVTDAEGRYEISYTSRKFLRAEKSGADLRVVVMDAKGKEVVSSEVLFNAPVETVVDLTLPPEGKTLSEFELLFEAILPLLTGQGKGNTDLKISELKEKDIVFLSKETGQPGERIAFLLAAVKANLETGETGLPLIGTHVAPSVAGTIPVEAFYGWFRQELPQDFSLLIQHPVKELMDLLAKAVVQTYIPVLSPEQLKTIEDSLHQMRIDQVLQPSADGKAAGLGDLLNTISGDWLSDNQRKNVAILLNTVNHESDDFLEKAKNAGFNKKQALQVRFTLQLGDLTLKHIPMVRALKTITEKDAEITLVCLAAISQGQWLELAFEHGAPPQTFMTPEQYAEHLDLTVESKVPTAMLLAKLENQAIKLQPKAFAGIKAVLAEHPKFDITTAEIDQFVIDARIKPETASALSKLQHLKRLDARWDEVEVLVNHGLDSFEEITNYNKNQFKRILSKKIQDEQLEVIHDKATALKAESIGLIGYLQPLLYGISTEVMGTQKNLAEVKEKIQSNPTLRKLFGALEHCQCDPCLSVLSPAAYLADLLKFIDSCYETSHEASFELRRRRPDIYDLELSCDNSQIELPHIDLAIEILENAVAFPYNVQLPVGTDIKIELAENKQVGASVRMVLEKTTTDKLGNLIAQVDPWTMRPLIQIFGTTYWIVNEHYRTWYLEAHEEFFGLIGPIRNPIKTSYLEEVIAQLDNNTIPRPITKTFYEALVTGVSSDIPLSVSEAIVIKPAINQLTSRKTWGIDFIVAGQVVIVLGEEMGEIKLTCADGTNTITHEYNTALLSEIKTRLNKGVMPTLLIQVLTGRKVESKQGIVEGFVVSARGKERNIWQYDYKYTGTRVLYYNPAEIQVVGLSYQSTATDRDLFARPQNRNPLAYEKLVKSEACFPWSLPFDLPLAETRETLRVAGVSRVSILEQTTERKDRYTSTQIVKERLGFSSAEWDYISTEKISANKATPEFLKIWGLNSTSTKDTITLLDTFIDKEISALPFGKEGLLTRVSILLQQARLSFAEFQQLLESDFINPDGTVNIQPDNVCQPSNMWLSMEDEIKLAPVLDRLHRFVRLWRATGWEVWELDLAIQAAGIGGNKLNSDALIQIANLGLLKERLNLPIDVMTVIFGGFDNKLYKQDIDGNIQNIVPLYDRLFQDRRLIDPPDTELVFSATATSSVPVLGKAALIAAALGIRPSDLLALLDMSNVDSTNPGKVCTVSQQNLKWIFRNVTLAKALRLSLTDYERVWQLFGESPFASPDKLLEFLDEIDFVRQSDFALSELEYLFLGTEPDQSENGLSIQRAVEVLSATQLELCQLNVPEKVAAGTSFGITDDHLKSPLMPDVPTSDKVRWEHWNLVPISGSSHWSVSDPADSSTKIKALPLELLERVDVLAQQARITNEVLTLVLRTIYVDPSKPQVLKIKSPAGVKTIQNLTTDHLDRLERFVVMLRASRLSPKELDLLLQAFCKTSSTAAQPLMWDLSKLIESGQSVLTLCNQFQLPLVTITGWWISGGSIELIKLAESLGIGTLDLSRLLAAFEAEKTIDPLASPSDLLEFVDASIFLKRRIELVTQHFAQAVSLEPGFVSTILWDYLHTSDTDPKSAMQYLITDTFKNSTDTINQDLVVKSDEYAILVRLHKIEMLNSKWKASLEELRWSNAEGLKLSDSFSGLVFDSLPYIKALITATTSDAIKAQLKKQLKKLVNGWKQSTKLYQVSHSSTEMAQVVGSYLDSFQKETTKVKKLEAARASLKSSFNLPDTTVKVCIDKMGISADDPSKGNQYLDPLSFNELIGLLAAVQRLGIDGSNLESIVSENPGLAGAVLCRKLLSPRFGESGWKKALRQITDTLRIQQRNRLVDYLLSKEELRDVNSLYEHFLIDVEMSPCMNTTRMLQSTAAIQLFVQRCLFNLEKNIPPESIARDRWEWMQNYRIWEANRKVFLYPENWLFPEVRDDRTETFRAFESALTQSEPSHENAVKALRQYLDDLVEVGQISVMGMYEHAEDLKELEEKGNQKYRRTLYLVGRSPNPPYTFFWRQAINYGQPGIRWTGWERINQDLSGDHIIPFIFEGDFHIAWPLIRQIKEGDDDNYEVQLAWARRTPTGWTKRKTSREPHLKVKKPFYRDERSLFAFKYLCQNDMAAIACYVATPPPTPMPDPPPFYETDQWGDTQPAKAWIPKITLVPGSEVLPDNSDIELVMTVRAWLLYTCKNAAVPGSPTTTKYKPTETLIFKGFPSPFNSKSANIFQIESGLYPALELKIPFTVSPLVPLIQAQRDAVFTVNLITPFKKTYNVLVDVVFEVEAITDINQISSETNMEMKSMGQFLFYPGSDGVWQPSNPPLSFTPPGQLYSWSSGLREPQFHSSEGIPSVFSHSDIPQFYALQASCDIASSTPQRLWYIEEGAVRFFAKENPDQSTDGLAVFPAGFGDSSVYKASLARSLDSLYTPLQQDAPINTVFGIGKLEIYYPLHPPLLPGKCDPRSVHQLAFDLRMPYANYNWEVFYHLPLAAATFLSRQHRFEDARRWFHYIFDPTTNDVSTGCERFWRFLPFRNAQSPDTITQLLEALAGAPADNQRRFNVQAQVSAWLEDPFNPFAVARLRPSAFEWSTVNSYIKNLIAWADQLFRRDTRESINESTLLYIMAAQILGSRPEKIRARVVTQQSFSYRTLKTLKGDLDAFSNNWLTLADSPFIKGLNPQPIGKDLEQLSSIGSLYFCVPPNEKLPELWDMVDDRLFKIRNCQNIEGITRSLPLYEAPIDPELLIRAKAAGLDLADVLADRFAPLPYYRYQVLLQKANEFCNEVKSLGGAILSAIEKKETEQLSLLRSSQEIAMLKLVELVKEEQIKEAQTNLEALQKTRSNSVDRFVFLQRQLGKSQISFDASGSLIVEQSLMTKVQETGSPDDVGPLSLINAEVEQLWKMQAAQDFAIVSAVTKAASGIAHAVGVAFDPSGTAYRVASSIGNGLSVVADGFGMVSSINGYLERRSGLIGSWQRRRDEWVQQSKMTAEEIRQIDKQIIALEIRKSIAEKELDNHRTQIEYASNIDDFMRHLKFSGESLYGWMEGQLAGLYFSAYQLAYDLAKKAERAYQFELGDPSSSFVQFGHWDNLRKGLLSGERLSQNLRRMEAAYLDRNRRELEITKHVSLRQLDPLALMQLRDTGECEFEVPEVLFDLDFAGHYFRRIKSVSVSVPCVVGPYASMSGTLTLLSSKVRDKTTGTYANEDNYKTSYLPTQSIATSTGQNDAGVFELNFRDERYLPFEGAGVISRWRFKLPNNFRPFDYDTISDIVLHFRYTAREGGEKLAFAANANISTSLNKLKVYGETDEGLWLLLDLRHDFPDDWHRYNKSTTDNAVTIKLGSDRFPIILRGVTINLTGIQGSSKPISSIVPPIIIAPDKLVTIDLTEDDFKGKDSWIALRYTIK